MEIVGLVLGLFSSLIPIAIVAAIVYAVVQWRRGRPVTAPDDPGMGTVRRIYFYTVALIALLVAVNGLAQIERFVIDGLFGSEVVSGSRVGLAIGISLSVVGLAVWGIHWRLIQRSVATMPTESRAVVRKLYVYVVLGIAAGFLLWSSGDILLWLFGELDFNALSWSFLTVWAVVWAYHWTLETGEGQPTVETLGIRRVYLYAVSIVTLVMAAMGVGSVIYAILREGYESVFTLPVLVATQGGLWGEEMRNGLALAIVGGAGWWAHFLYFARGEARSVVRQIYLFASALVGGVGVAGVGLGILLFGLLVWLIGVPEEDGAAGHFRFLTDGTAVLVVGAALLLYHRAALRSEAGLSPMGEASTARAYSYVVAAAGLAVLATGAGIAVSNVVAILFEGSRGVLTGSDSWRNPVALSITLAVLGAPAWGYYWRTAQQRAETDADERGSLARRIFLFTALGAGALALLGGLSYMLFVLLRDLLEGEIGTAMIHDGRHAIGVTAAALLFVPYYWLVYRRDRELDPEEPEEAATPRKGVSLLAGADSEPIARALEEALGYEVVLLRWADSAGLPPALEQADFEEMARRIGAAHGANVLVALDETGARIMSYD